MNRINSCRAELFIMQNLQYIEEKIKQKKSSNRLKVIEPNFLFSSYFFFNSLMFDVDDEAEPSSFD
jgi:hypothetical protein